MQASPFLVKKKRKSTAWTPAKYKKAAIELAKKIVRDESKGICAKCKKFGAVQGSHVYSVGAHSDMAAMVENILPMCFACHHYWWHGNPMDAFAWFAREYPDRYKRLSTRAQTTQKVDWLGVYEKLKGGEVVVDLG